MIRELEDFSEHLIRFRAVTLQALESSGPEDLSWRPGPDHYSLGQLFLHIAQAEDFHIRGQFQGDWDTELIRFPDPLPTKAEILRYHEEVRERTLEALDGLTPNELDRPVELGPDQPDLTLRSWLWFVLEHEIHHKGQIATYLRQMGKTSPFFATPLPKGERPDAVLRQELGGF